MKKWSYNAQMMYRLSDIMEISVTAIAHRSNINQSVLFHAAKGDTELTVQYLIMICNALRIPSRYFISEGNDHIIPNRETATIEADHWKTITWDTEEVKTVFGEHKGQINWKDVADVMGLTSQKPHERFVLKTRFPITSFLDTCTYYNISPYRFLKDDNSLDDAMKHKRSATMKKSVAKATAKKPKAPTPPTYAALSRKVEKLEHSVADLQQRLADMQGKYADTLNRYNDMQQKYTVLLTAYNKLVSMNGEMDLAAENGPKK